MDDVLMLDNMMFDGTNYGGDLRLLDSVLAATGFESINFTPINVDQSTLFTARKRRRIVYNDRPRATQHQFDCGICNRTFTLKKTRDRHQESVHKQLYFPCSTCNRSFHRKDIRNRHQAEKHSGRRRTARALACISSNPNAEAFAQDDINEPIQQYQQHPINIPDALYMPMEAQVELYLSMHPEDIDIEDDDDHDERRERIHDCLGSSKLIDTNAVNNPLLLCTNLLLTCKPYRRFFIHDKKRDLVCRQRWKPPNTRFGELYDLAIRSLGSRLASGSRDIEFLAAMVAFVNVDVLISGSERMGDHARAMYSLKAHHHARRDPIFEALQKAFEHCGKTCRSIRIIYTKRGFVWMLNMGYRCLSIPVD